jgi:hypothetical protein
MRDQSNKAKRDKEKQVLQINHSNSYSYVQFYLASGRENQNEIAAIYFSPLLTRKTS